MPAELSTGLTLGLRPTAPRAAPSLTCRHAALPLVSRRWCQLVDSPPLLHSISLEFSSLEFSSLEFRSQSEAMVFTRALGA